MRRSPTAAIVAGTLAALQLAGAPSPAAAAPVRIFVTQTAPAFLQGTLDDVSVDSTGVLSLAARAERVAGMGEPFAFALAAAPRRLGGRDRQRRPGARGRARRNGDRRSSTRPSRWSSRSGRTRTARSSPAPRRRARSIASPAVAQSRTSTRRRPTSGPSRAARTARSGWRPAPRVACIASPPRIRGAWRYDSDDTHLRSLLVLPGGDLLIGTAPSGMVLRLERTGLRRARRLRLGARRGGGVRAGARRRCLGSGAGLGVEPARVGAAAAARDPGGGAERGAVRRRVRDGGRARRGRGAGASAPFRPPTATGPRSELVRDPRPRPGRTDLDLVRRDDLRAALPRARGSGSAPGSRASSTRSRVTGRAREGRRGAPDRGSRCLATRRRPSPPPTRRRSAAFTRRRGAARDLHQRRRSTPARWRASASSAGAASSAPEAACGSPSAPASRAEPDRTWSAWTRAGASGAEVALDAVPRGRYVQWPAELEGGTAGEPAALAGTEISYRQENLRPEDRAASSPSSRARSWCRPDFNPADQVYEPAHPNREGIFTTLEPAAPPRRAVARRSGRRATARCAGARPIPTATR